MGDLRIHSTLTLCAAPTTALTFFPRHIPRIFLSDAALDNYEVRRTVTRYVVRSHHHRHIVIDMVTSIDEQVEQPVMHTRGYQQELLQESLRRNIIIALDTGSGKTHIAMLRMKHEVERQTEKARSLTRKAHTLQS